MTQYRSPIEQQLIDGNFYWDNIAAEWFRLIEHKTHNVAGHYRPEDMWRTRRWIAVRFNSHDDILEARKEARAFVDADSAREWIESNVKDQWLQTP